MNRCLRTLVRQEARQFAKSKHIAGPSLKRAPVFFSFLSLTARGGTAARVKETTCTSGNPIRAIVRCRIQRRLAVSVLKLVEDATSRDRAPRAPAAKLLLSLLLPLPPPPIHKTMLALYFAMAERLEYERKGYVSIFCLLIPTRV